MITIKFPDKINKDKQGAIKRGFTLIEVLTVVILVGMIVTASFSTYASSRERNQLNTDASTIEAAFNKVRSDAITGLTIANSLPKSYGLYFTENESDIILFAETADTPNYRYDDDDDGEELQTITLDKAFIEDIYVLQIGDAEAGTDDTWDNADITKLSLSFLLPRAELKLLADNSTDTEIAVCVEIQSPQGMLKSFVVDQRNAQISFAKTPCSERETV